MSVAIYPAIVERAGSGFSVFFPDLPGCTSAGDTLNEALLNAEEALSGHLLVSAQHGDQVAPPSDISAWEPDPEVEVYAHVLVRAEAPGKAVRINIMIDEGLVHAIDRVESNRSRFLAEAAREKLIRRREMADA